MPGAAYPFAASAVFISAHDLYFLKPMFLLHRADEWVKNIVEPFEHRGCIYGWLSRQE
jgi:hypothetical protein